VNRVLPFAIAGLFGYLADAAMLSLSLGLLGPVGGRMLSFACGVLTTWLINRHFAFADHAAQVGKRYELLRYVLAMLPGGGINWLIYGLAMTALPSSGWRPAIAVAAGSLAGMVVNLVAADKLVFRAQRPD